MEQNLQVFISGYQNYLGVQELLLLLILHA